MKYYDVTLPIQEEMITYPGDPPFQIKPYYEKHRGDPCNLASLSMGTHVGTHVDAPAHHLDDGATVDEIPLDSLVGPGVVLDLRGSASVDRQALEETLVDDVTRVMLKTDNGPLLLEPEFYKDHFHLTHDGAAYLIERGVRLIGIDYLSIESYGSPRAVVHRLLLEAGVVVVEGVNLLEISPGHYEFFCLPLLIKGADGAPARVILRQ